MEKQEVQLLNKVTLKAVCTDELKRRLAAEYNNLLTEAEMELQQLEFQSKRLLASADKANPQQRLGLKQELDQKKKDAEAKRERIRKQLQQLQAMQTGEEVYQGTLSGVATVRVGDNLNEKLARELVIKDGFVVEIRPGME